MQGDFRPAFVINIVWNIDAIIQLVLHNGQLQNQTYDISIT